MDDWHWAMSLNQARAIRLGVEHLRALSPVCAGAIVWQLNDCWPVVSWAAVDGDGRRKPMFYALRGAFADHLLTVQPDSDGLQVVLVNDTAEPWNGPLSVSRCTYEGKALATEEIAVEVEPRSTRTVPLSGEIAIPGTASGELLVAQVGGARTTWFFAEDRDSALAAPALRAEASRTPEGYEVTVTATALVRDLALLADKLDPAAVVDDMLVTLLPGETVTFRVASFADLAPEEFLATTVLRSANQLVAPTPRG
jgi:beta-mannosidase